MVPDVTQAERYGLGRMPGGLDLPDLCSADTVEMASFLCADDGIVPNNPDLPVIMLRGAIRPGAGPRAVMALFEANGWRRVWHYTVFDYHHYHPDAHEALAVASGWADIQIGGSSGDVHRVTEGDVMILPAGTGHCRIEAGDEFSVCGAYPPGQEGRTILRADRSSRDDDMPTRIAALARPVTDPVYGTDGPLLRAWA